MDEALDDFVKMMLEDETLEEFLERFNLDVSEAIECLIDNGMLDLEQMKEMAGRG